MSGNGSKSSFELVGEFHEVFGHPKRSVPTEPEAHEQRLRLNLILEEVSELVEAVFGDTTVPNSILPVVSALLKQCMELIRGAEDREFYNNNTVEIADALTDILYVVNGAGHCFGINLDMTMGEVHDSNMSKLGEDGMPIYNPDTGKIIKGPNFREPELANIIYIGQQEKVA